MILEISNGERASRAVSTRDDPVNSQSQNVVRASPSKPHSTPYIDTESPPLGNRVCQPPGDGSAACPYRGRGAWTRRGRPDPREQSRATRRHRSAGSPTRWCRRGRAARRRPALRWTAGEPASLGPCDAGVRSRPELRRITPCSGPCCSRPVGRVGFCLHSALERPRFRPSTLRSVLRAVLAQSSRQKPTPSRPDARSPVRSRGWRVSSAPSGPSPSGRSRRSSTA